MRRMNSMLLGHQGASGRTDWVYLRMASWVAGSSHDSGRWTIREATSISSVAGSAAFHLLEQRQQPFARQPAIVVVDLQRTNAGGQIDDARELPRICRATSASCSAWTRKRSARSSTGGPYSINRLASPSWRITTAGRSSRAAAVDSTGEPGATDVARFVGAAGAAEDAAESVSMACALRARALARLVEGDGNEADHVARLELAHLPELGLDDGGGTDEAAQAGAVGAEQDRHVAGEVDGADGVGVVVDVRRVQAGLAAVGARPARLRPDEAHARAAGVVVNAPAGGVERGDVLLDEEVGRRVRAGHDRDLPGLGQRRDERGRQRCRVHGAAADESPGRSTSPGCSARPPWPPKRPSVKVARLPR